MKKRHAAALGIAGLLLLFCLVDVVRSKANGILDGISFSGAYADRNGKLLRVYRRYFNFAVCIVIVDAPITRDRFT